MRRRLLQLALIVIGAALLALAGWGGHRWWTYPKYPDVNHADLHDVWRFMASDDFRKLSRSHQQRYAMAEVERINRELKFPDIVRMLSGTQYDQRALVANLRQLPDYEAAEAAWVRVFLDKFFELDRDKRTLYLTLLASMQQSEIMKHPERFGLPSIGEFRNNVSVFFAHQPPRVQGQMGQFLRDLKKTRTAMGLKDPF
jgi:hypothetical protein